MAYSRRGNLPRPDGSPSRWAAKLVGFTANEIVKERVGNAMFASHIADIERSLLILPRQTEGGLEVVALFRPKLAAGRLQEINAYYQAPWLIGLCELWDRYAHAYVHFAITPANLYRGNIIDHNATIRATLEIDDLDWQILPELEEFDQALGLGLATAHANWMSRNEHAVMTVAKADGAPSTFLAETAQ